MTLDNTRERFRQYLKNEKKLKPSTVACYDADVDLLFQLLSEAGCEYRALTVPIWDELMSRLTAQGRSPASLRRIASSAKCFYAYLIRMKLCAENPIRPPVDAAPEAEKNTALLSEAEVSRLFSQPDPGTFKGIRDRLLLQLVYSSSLKICDLLALTFGDVDFKTGRIQVRTNPNQEAERFLVGPPTIAALNEYTGAYNRLYEMPRPESPLFINRRFSRLTRQGLWKIVREYGKAAGLTEDITPAVLRRSYAFHLMDKGAAPEDLMRIFHYRSLSSVKAILAGEYVVK